MQEARIVIGQGDEERDCGLFDFVGLPRTGENLLIALEEGLVPLRVAEVFHQPVRKGSVGFALIVVRAEKR